MINKRLINTGVEAAPAAFDPLQNFEVVTYTGNGGTQKITGYIRKGAAFNGSSSKIDLQLTTGLSGADPRSVSLWVNVPALPGVIYCFYSSGTNSDGQAFQFSVTSTGAISVSYYNRNINTTTTLSTNTWYHIVATYKGGDISTFSNTEIYINGSAQTLVAGGGSVTGTANIPDTNHSIGYAKLDNLYFLNGKIDQVRIFDKALSSGEVTTLYGETYASSTKSTTDIFGDGSGVALYELDEDANDTGLYGSGAIDSGQSAVFNGSSSYINFGDSPELRLTGSYSVSGWANFNSIPASTQRLITKDNANDYSGGYSLNVNSTNIYWQHNNGSATAVGYAHSFSTGTWYHFTITYDSSTTTNNLKLYINGSNVSTSNAASPINGESSNYLFFGTYGSTSPSGQYFNGKLDQVRIYSSALSASDVEALVSETNVPTANLTAHYKLDGNANDETGSYNGTATSITYSDPAEFPAYNGTPTNVNFLGMAFQPDLVWIKGRIQNQHSGVFDSVRGADLWLRSGTTDAENDFGGGYGVTSFDTNGFTIGSGSAINNNGDGNVAWCWKAGGSAVSNTNGTITSQVSANQDAGFSIVKFPTTATNVNVGHGLSQAPEMIIYKNTTFVDNWYVYHKDLSSPNTQYLNLNTTSQAITNATNNFSSVTSDTFTSYLASGGDIVCYCFHSVDGYQKVGYHTSDASVKITTGFEPRWIMQKYTGVASNWWIMDTSRYDGSTGSHGGKLVKPYLEANTSNAEGSVPPGSVEFVSDGFYPTNFFNSNGVIYLAIA